MTEKPGRFGRSTNNQPGSNPAAETLDADKNSTYSKVKNFFLENKTELKNNIFDLQVLTDTITAADFEMLTKEEKEKIWGKILVSSGDKVSQNRQPSSVNKKDKPKAKPVSTTQKQSMAYLTVRNIENETGFIEADWPLFILKELTDNAWDWLNDFYPAINRDTKSVRKIGVRLWITDEGEDQNIRFVHVAVRNSNVDNIPVFQDLDRIFDFNVMHSTKRNQHRMTCGSLGDALKRSLGMGYASWTKDYNADETFDDKQWEQPVIVRCNGKEFRAYIIVDIAKQERWTEITEEKKPSRDIGNDTEVEITLPILNSLDEDSSWWLGRLLEYHQKSKIGKLTRTDFSIETAEEQKQKAKEVEVKQQ